MSFGVERISLDLHGPFLVEFNELLLMVEDLFEEFLSSGSTTVFLAAAHLLFKSVERARFFFRLSEHFGASVKVSVYELSFKENVTLSFGNHLRVGLLVAQVV